MAQLDDGSQIFPNGKTVVYHHFPPSIFKKMVGSGVPAGMLTELTNPTPSNWFPHFIFQSNGLCSPQVARLHDHRVNQYRCNGLALFFLTVQGRPPVDINGVTLW